LTKSSSRSSRRVANKHFPAALAFVARPLTEPPRLGRGTPQGDATETQRRDGRPQQTNWDSGTFYQMNFCGSFPRTQPAPKPAEPSPGGGTRTLRALTIQEASYALDRLERTVNPAHHNYQVRLKRFFESVNFRAEGKRILSMSPSSSVPTSSLAKSRSQATRLEEAFRLPSDNCSTCSHEIHRATKTSDVSDRDLDEKRLP
jgi:hypothetical protein